MIVVNDDDGVNEWNNAQAKRQQKKMMKEAFKEEKKLADRKKALGKSGSVFKM